MFSGIKLVTPKGGIPATEEEIGVTKLEADSAGFGGEVKGAKQLPVTGYPLLAKSMISLALSDGKSLKTRTCPP